MADSTSAIGAVSPELERLILRAKTVYTLVGGDMEDESGLRKKDKDSFETKRSDILIDLHNLNSVCAG